MRAFIRLIDNLLSKAYRVEEFTDDPGCILRIQLTSAPHAVDIEGQSILKGASLLALHAWNERMPNLPPQGPNLEWALQLRRKTVYSFTLIARVIQTDCKYKMVRGVYGTSALFSFSDHTGGTRLMQHLGFTVLPYHHPAGRFGEFWENLFSWWLMYAYNDVSLHSRRFWRLNRTEIWMTVQEFLHRYGENV